MFVKLNFLAFVEGNVKKEKQFIQFVKDSSEYRIRA